MPISDHQKRRVVTFGHGDLTIQHLYHPTLNCLTGLELTQISQTADVGESIQVDPTTIQQQPKVVLEFCKLESLDLLLQQLKLLRGSQADGESLRGQIAHITDGEYAGQDAVFQRVIDGNVRECVLYAQNGLFITKAGNQFYFKNAAAQNYFQGFFNWN